MMKRIWPTFFIFILTVLVRPSVSNAMVEIPDFPHCSNPSGEIIAQYPNGVHGIPGDSRTHTGSDVVYRINDYQVLQCLCSGSDGIQSIWWRDPGLSESDISRLLSKGWVRVVDGSLWGLESSQYFVKNSSFSCTTGVGGLGGGSSSENSSNSESNELGGIGGLGQILGVSSLASTGNWKNILMLLAVSFSATLLAILIRKLNTDS